MTVIFLRVLTQTEKSANQFDQSRHEAQGDGGGRHFRVDVVEREQSDDGRGTDGNLSDRSEHDVHYAAETRRV